MPASTQNISTVSAISLSSQSDAVKYTKREPDDSQIELLRDSEPIDYNEDSMAEYTDDLTSSSSRSTRPIVGGSGRTSRGWQSDTDRDFLGNKKPKGIFDDV